MTRSFLPISDSVHERVGYDPGQSAGLFVGVRRFVEDPDLAEIPYAVDDAIDLAHLFALELQLIAADAVTLCLSGDPQKSASGEALDALLAAGAQREAATQARIYQCLGRLGRETSAGGLYVVSLATHGFSDETGDYLVAGDSLRRRIKQTGIEVDAVFEDVSRGKAERRLLLVDACRERLSAGKRALGSEEGAGLGERFQTAVAQASGMVVLTGTTLGGFSYDDHERRNGVFSSAVVDGLRGKAQPDERGFVTPLTLADYVNARVLAWIRDHRPSDSQISRGIGMRLEGLAARMPLAAVTGGEPPAPPPNLGEMAVAVAEGAVAIAEGAPPRRRLFVSFVLGVVACTCLVGLVYGVSNWVLGPTTRPSQNTPAWVHTLPSSLRPPVLPPGVAYAEEEGEYAYAPDGSILVWVPPASFQMGDFDDLDIGYQPVYVSRGFFIGKHEVTRAQAQTLFPQLPEFEHLPGEQLGPQHPVTGLTWQQARDYCTTHGGELPSEAQWELAARGTREGNVYPWGETFPNAELVNLDRTFPDGIPHVGEAQRDGYIFVSAPVGSFPKGASPFGALDMAGNAAEWVLDAYAPYDATEGELADPLLIEGEERVVRGGSFRSTDLEVRAFHRWHADPAQGYPDVGFRIVVHLPE